MAALKTKLNHIRAFAFDVDGVLSRDIIVHPNGDLMRTMNVKDGYAMHYALKKGYLIAIITGGTDELVRKRFERLNITELYMASMDKIVDFNDFCAKHQITPEQVLYMGDDIPDIAPIKAAGIGSCPADAAVDVKQAADYISDLKGGDGCVRDVLEQVMRAQGTWLTEGSAQW